MQEQRSNQAFLVASLLIATAFFLLLYAYVFVWQNTPNLVRLLGFDA